MNLPLKERRLQLGLSQRRLARRANVAYKTVQLIESGRHDPRRSTLEKLAAALGVPATAVLGRGPAHPVAAASAAMVGQAWRIPLFELVDEFRRRPRSQIVAAAPEPGLSHRLHALLASTVEALCAEADVGAPWWCAGVPPLRDPWFVSGAENLKAAALVESPAWFRRRNIFVLENFLSRA